MKKALLILSMLGLMAAPSIAQDLPQPSPAATNMQRIGLTDFKMEYSRPGVKGRTIFGDLVPYNEMWRTGANKANQFTSSTEFNFGSTAVPAGTYSLFSIPGEKECVLLLNSETELWGTGDYDESKEVARFTAQVEIEDESGERLEFWFSDITENAGILNLMWDTYHVKVPLSVEVQERAMANIKSAIEIDPSWQKYRNAASYCLNSNTNLDMGKDWINESLARGGDKSWYTYWVKAQILNATGDVKSAKIVGKKAIAVGEEAAKAEGEEFQYAEGLKEDMAGW